MLACLGESQKSELAGNKIDHWDMNESALSVKATLQEPAMPVVREPAKRSRTLQDHDCGYAGRLAGGLCCKVVHQRVDKAADFAVESLVVSEEDERTSPT